MSPRALITGGAGFIGSHLAERLLEHDYRVTVLDDLSTGAIANLAHLPEGDDLTFVGGSITDTATVNDLVGQADHVFHLAASVGVKRIVDSPIESISTNIRGTEVLLEASARFEKPTIVASTSEVYGKSSKIPFSEDDDLVLGPTHNLRWSYAASKAIDEFLTLAYVRDSGLPATIVRLFNTVGRRQTGRYGMVIPRFVKQAINGEPITVHGDGAQRRAFAHVSDAVEAIHKLSLSPEATGQVFNVGNDVEISIYELAELVRERAKSDSPIIKVPYEQAFGEGFEDIRRRVPDLTRVRSAVGYTPTWTIEEIVDDVVAHFREQTGFS
jgi:UDP-glucose 4-epimerase